MDEMHAALDRLEAQIEDQTARIDALYALLELRGILPQPEAPDVSCGWDGQRRPTARRARHFHLGEATGV